MVHKLSCALNIVFVMVQWAALKIISYKEGQYPPSLPITALVKCKKFSSFRCSESQLLQKTGKDNDVTS